VNHDDHVRLIEGGIARGGVWADLGAGAGAFTLALRDIAGPKVEIIAIDRDRGSLRTLRDEMGGRFPGTHLRLVESDFVQSLDLPPLDGVLVANAIHFVPARDQAPLLRRWREYLKPEGQLIVVEYDAEQGNRWVPYPVSFTTLRKVARAAGFAEPVLLGARPSRWMGRMYAAAAHPVP
jgi:ubiquinone/menaquinone biosynthesis C-methylase UbiE